MHLHILYKRAYGHKTLNESRRLSVSYCSFPKVPISLTSTNNPEDPTTLSVIVADDSAPLDPAEVVEQVGAVPD
jgi:hypothetical protein